MKFNRQYKCMVSEVQVMVTSVDIYTGRGRREPLWSDGNVLHIDLDGDHTEVHTYKRALSCTEVMCSYCL